MHQLVNKCFLFLIMMCISGILYSQDEETIVKEDTIPEYVKLYNKASSLADSGKFNDAMPILKKVLKLNPDYYSAHNKMAFIFIKNKKYKDAEKSLDKAEKISPINFETQKLKGITYFHTERFKESKSAIDSAAEVAKIEKIDDAELFYYQAMLLFKAKNYKPAINSCQSALELQPKYLDVLKLKGEIRFNMKDYPNAIKELDEAIKAMPEKDIDYNYYKMRAKSKFNIKDFKGSSNDWSNVLEAEPKDEEALISRANCKINLGDNTSAIVDLDEAIKINPKNPVSYCNRGIAKSGNKSNVEAIKDLDYAIKLKFDYAEAYFRRAAVKFKSKDKHGACEDLAKADSLGDPDAFKLIDQYCKVK